MIHVGMLYINSYVQIGEGDSGWKEWMLDMRYN